MIDNYIERNAKYAVRNAMCFFLWRGQSWNESIQKEREYLSEYHYCNPQDFIAEMHNILYSCRTMDGLKKFIRSIQECCVSRISLEKFAKKEFDDETMTLQKLLSIAATMDNSPLGRKRPAERRGQGYTLKNTRRIKNARVQYT